VFLFDVCSYSSDDCDDSILDAHEAEERRLEEREEELTPILAAIEEREALIADKLAMDLSASDPARLTSKSRRDPGRLLREERV